MWCGWQGSPRKFTQPMTRTMPLAHDSGLPRVSGEGRLRARMPASFRHNAPYSSSRYSWQKASVMPTISSCAVRAAWRIVGSPAGYLGLDSPVSRSRISTWLVEASHGGWREGRDDPLPLLGVVVGLLEPPANPAAERDVVARKQAVVDDPSLERQEDRLAQKGESGADQILEGVREREDAIGDDRLLVVRKTV